MKKKRAILLIAIMGIAVLSLLIACVSIPREAQDAFNRGWRAYQMENYDQAIAEYTEAIRLYPDYTRAYQYRAELYYGMAYSDRKAEYISAIIADSEAVLRLNPNNRYARGMLITARQWQDGSPTQTAQATPVQTTPVQAVPVQTAPTRPLTEDDFEIKQNPDNTITITGYKGEEKNVVIPDTLYGLKVTIIGAEAFRGDSYLRKSLTSVVIPDTVTTIEHGYSSTSSDYGAFSDNRTLTKLTLGKGLKTIGNYAFSSTGLTEVIIPDSVTVIGNGAFQGGEGSDKLVKVTFGTGLQSIGRSAFRNNQIAELNLPSSLRELGIIAFAGNKIQKITFGTGLQKIEEGTFSGNQITELNLPSSLKEIGGGAFADNKIQKITWSTRLEIIGVGAFRNNQIAEVNLPSSVKEIRRSPNVWSFDKAFGNNPLTTVVIPPSLVNGRIDRESFGDINGSTITRITIPAGMNENILKGIFEVSFVNFWINQNRAGGTYVKRGPIWVKE